MTDFTLILQLLLLSSIRTAYRNKIAIISIAYAVYILMLTLLFKQKQPFNIRLYAQCSAYVLACILLEILSNCEQFFSIIYNYEVLNRIFKWRCSKQLKQYSAMFCIIIHKLAFGYFYIELLWMAVSFSVYVYIERNNTPKELEYSKSQEPTEVSTPQPMKKFSFDAYTKFDGLKLHSRSNSIDYISMEDTNIISMLDMSILLITKQMAIKYSNIAALKLINTFKDLKEMLLQIKKPNTTYTLHNEISECFENKRSQEPTKNTYIRYFENKRLICDNDVYNISTKYIPSYDCVLLLIYDKPHHKKLSSSLVNDCLMEITSCSLFHELFNLTNGIIGHLELLESAVPTNKQKILKSAQLYSRILSYRLRDIDDFTKISIDKFKMHISYIETRTIYRELKSIVGTLAKIKQVDFKFDFNSKSPQTIVTDKGRLLQILINTLSTLIESLDNGKITLSIQQESTNTIQFTINITDPHSSKLTSLFEDIKSFQSICEKGSSALKNMEGLALASTSIIALKIGKGMDFKKIDKHYEVHIFVKDGFKMSAGAKRGRASSIRIKEVDDEISHCKTLRFASQDETKYIALGKVTTTSPKVIQKYNDNDEVDITDVPEEIEYQLPPLPMLQPVLKHLMPHQSSKDIGRRKKIRCNTLLDTPVSATNKYLDRSFDDNQEFNCIIADDNDTNLFVLKELLKSLSMNSILAKNGLECLLMIKDYILKKSIHNIKVIFMDMQMPVMDGVESTKAIIRCMEENGLKRVPIIGVSSSNNEEDRCKFIKAGISEFIQKPVTRDTLSALIIKHTGY